MTLSQDSPRPKKAPRDRPTEAELEMLRLVAAGHSQKEATGLLGLSRNGARRRLQRCADRLGLESVMQLLILAGEKQWVGVTQLEQERR